MSTALKEQLKESLAVMDGGKPTVSTIAGKLVAAMDEIDAVTKQGRNQAQGYQYVRAADVANEVRKVLVKHRIAFTYSVLAKERWQTDRFGKDGTVVGVMNYIDLTIGFTFIDADSGDSITLQGIGWASDTGDKAPYKAMTGALKYALRMNFIIPDESDPEDDSRETKGDSREVAQKRAAEERTKLADAQGIFSANGDLLNCVVKGVQEKVTTSAKKAPFLIVMFNGRLPNGANFGSTFDKDLFEPLRNAVNKECILKLEFKDQWVNIKDVVWIEGLGPKPQGE